MQIRRQRPWQQEACPLIRMQAAAITNMRAIMREAVGSMAAAAIIAENNRASEAERPGSCI